MESWYDRALCVDAEVDFFSEDPLEMQMAKSICHECPVRRQCLQSALDNEDRFGVWGSIDQKELRKLLFVDQFGKPVRRFRKIECPNCQSDDLKYELTSRTRRRITCESCDFSWVARNHTKLIDIDEEFTNETSSDFRN